MRSRRMVAGMMILAALISLGPTAAAAQVTIRVGGDFTQDWWQQTFERFETETGIAIEQGHVPWGTEGMEKFITETAAGLTYDLVTMDSRWLGAIQGKGMVRPLNDLIRRDHFPIDDFFGPLVDAVSTGDVIWGIPGGIDEYVPFINLDMWDRAGLPYPAKDWTWQEYEAVMKKLTHIDPEGENNVFGGNGLLWPVVAWSFGASVITPEGEFDMDSDRVIQGLQWSFDLRNEARVFPRSSAEVGGVANHARLAAGKVASHWVGSWYPTSTYMKGSTVRWGVAMPPSSPYGRAT
ncbi:MAG TPA: extracellular solute-binding protein, partial [Limnochordia bacterium]